MLQRDRLEQQQLDSDQDNYSIRPAHFPEVHDPSYDIFRLLPDKLSKRDKVR